MNKNLFLFAAIFATGFYLGCTDIPEIPDEPYNEPSSSSDGNSGYEPPSSSSMLSSSSVGIISQQLYCDYTSEHSLGGGGGCETIDDASECDIVLGEVTTSCDQSKLFCNYGAATNYGPGGCYKIEYSEAGESECRKSTGSPTGSCPANSIKSYCLDTDGDCARINCFWVENLRGCISSAVTRNWCIETGHYIYDCLDD